MIGTAPGTWNSSYVTSIGYSAEKGKIYLWIVKNSDFIGGRNSSGNSSGLCVWEHFETWLSIPAGNLLTEDFSVAGWGWSEGVKIGLFPSPCLAASSCTDAEWWSSQCGSTRQKLICGSQETNHLFSSGYCHSICLFFFKMHSQETRVERLEVLTIFLCSQGLSGWFPSENSLENKQQH